MWITKSEFPQEPVSFPGVKDFTEEVSGISYWKDVQVHCNYNGGHSGILIPL